MLIAKNVILVMKDGEWPCVFMNSKEVGETWQARKSEGENRRGKGHLRRKKKITCKPVQQREMSYTDGLNNSFNVQLK